jgi:hypothetical protein
MVLDRKTTSAKLKKGGNKDDLSSFFIIPNKSNTSPQQAKCHYRVISNNGIYTKIYHSL